MTDGKQISVAELLARNGQQNGGSQNNNGGGRRRRGGRSGGVSVASLTGDLPVVPPLESEVPQQPEPAQPVVQQPMSNPMPAVQQPVMPQQAQPNLAPQAFAAPTAEPQQAVPAPLPSQHLGWQGAHQGATYHGYEQQNLVQPTSPTMPAPHQNLVQPTSPTLPAAPAQSAMPQQFAIQPPAAPPNVGPAAGVSPYGFGESGAAAQPVAEQPAPPVKRRTRAERRAAEERERAQREASAGPTSHAKPDTGEQPVVEQPTYSAPQTSPTVITPPVMPQTYVTQAPPPAPQPMIDSSPTVMEPGSIPGFQPAAFDPVSQTYAPPAADAEATALNPTVPGAKSGGSKPRGFHIGRFGGHRTDDAPTEIRQPDPKAKSNGKADQQVPDAGGDVDATSIWPATPVSLDGARPLTIDDPLSGAQPQSDSARTSAEPKSRKDKVRKQKKQPQRASAMDFPTAAWQMSGSESQLLSGNSSLAGDLLRQEPPRPETQRSEALRSEPLRSEALRSEALRSEAPHSEPTLRSEPMRSEALRSEALRSEALRSEAMRADAPPADHANTELIPADQLLAGPSLAGELMRGGPEEPFEPTEHYHNPQPDDQPTDVDHPFFSHGPGDDDFDDRPLDPSELGEEEEDSGRTQRAWWIQVGQWLVAGVSGVLLFKGFEVLWVHMAMVALALAVTVILGLVALVRILRRTDDILSLGIAVAVGVFVTLGPLAFTLQTG